MSPQNWYAWINTMPPKPDDFHVTGNVEIPNPGVQVLLTPRQSAGSGQIDLDLRFHQRPGMWPPMTGYVQARYDEVLPPVAIKYKRAEVFLDGKSIASVAVDEIH